MRRWKTESKRRGKGGEGAGLELLGKNILQPRRFQVGVLGHLSERADKGELAVALKAIVLRLQVDNDRVTHLPPLGRLHREVLLLMQNALGLEAAPRRREGGVVSMRTVRLGRDACELLLLDPLKVLCAGARSMVARVHGLAWVLAKH